MTLTYRATLTGIAVAASLAFAPAAALAAGALPHSAIQELGFGQSFVAYITDETVGWTFTANADLEVTRVGWYVVRPLLFDDHALGIWNSQGALLGSATVVARGDYGDDFFSYASLPAPVVLQAGQTYFIGGRDTEFDDDNYMNNATYVQTDPAITFLGSARSAVGSGFAFPNITIAGARGRFGPNFQFNILAAPPPGSAAPEPGAWALMLLGFGGLGAALRTRRRSAAATY